MFAFLPLRLRLYNVVLNLVVQFSYSIYCAETKGLWMMTMTLYSLNLFVVILKNEVIIYQKYNTIKMQRPVMPEILNDLVHILTNRHANGSGVNPILLASRSE